MGGMAWALDIRKKRDTHGNEIPVHWDNYTPLLIAKPVKFQFDAVVREPYKMRAVTEMFADADGDTLCDSRGDDFSVNVRDTPPLSPIHTEVERHERHREFQSADDAGLHCVPADKRRRRSLSGSWPESLLVAQGPIVVR
jgi:hypothetical protein